MRAFADAVPSVLPILVPQVYNKLQRSLKQCKSGTQSDDATLPYRLQCCVGHAYAAGMLACVVARYPLDASFETNAWIFSLGSQLLKNATTAAKEGEEIDPRIALTNMKCAWILLAALNYAGPDFVSLHLSQLLLLWKTALPRPSTRDADASNRSEAAWTYLLHGRYLALTALLGLLRKNRELLTPDLTKRVAALIMNAWATLNSVPVPESKSSLMASSQSIGTPDSAAFEDNRRLLKLRIFECLIELQPITLVENSFKELSHAAAQVFLEPECVLVHDRPGRAAYTEGAHVSMFALMTRSGFEGMSPRPEVSEMKRVQTVNTNLWQSHPDVPLSSPEYNPTALFSEQQTLPLVDAFPPAFSIVNASVRLFAELFPRAPEKEQVRLVGMIIAALSSPQLEHDVERREAVRFNVVHALLECFSLAETLPRKEEGCYFNDDIAFRLQKILQVSI
jgi:hypothetical protein